jgi:hypothetical protein
MAQSVKKPTLMAAMGIVLLGAAALWGLQTHSPADDAAIATTEAQFRTICDVVQADVGVSCGARARADQASSAAMSHDPGVAQPVDGRPQLPARVLDGWGNAVQISIGSEGVTVRSFGRDGEPGSADDLTRLCPRNAPS